MPGRSRSTGSIFVGQCVGSAAYRNPQGVMVTYPVSLLSRRGHHKAIVDQTGPAARLSGLPKTMRPTKGVRSTDYSYDLTGIQPGYSWTDWYYNVVLSPWPVPWTASDDLQLRQDAGWKDFADPEVCAFCEGAILGSEVQCPEIIDVPSLIVDLVQLRGLRKQVAKLASVLRKLPTSVARGAWRDIVRMASDAGLLGQYGVAPTVRDIEQVFRQFRSIGDRLNYLRLTVGRPITFRRRQSWTKSTNRRYLVETITGGPSAIVREWEYTVTGSATAAATITMMNHLRGLEERLASWNALNAELGGNQLLRVGWDLVPWSFVVDWFIPVSGWLERLAPQPFAGELKIVNKSFSVKNGVGATFKGSLDTAHGAPWVGAGRIALHSYQRSPSLPARASMFSGSLSPTQRLIMLALFGQRL